MVWCVFAILSGFFVALSDALNKKYLSSFGHPYMVIARTLGSFPFLFPIFLFLTYKYDGFSFFSFQFITNVFVLLILEITATILYMKGIKLSPISLTVPFLSFTPVFIIFTGYLLLGEKISSTGALGIVLVFLGSYCINFPSIREGFLAPVKAIKKEKGSFLLLQVAFIYSITSVLGKKGLILSNPLWFAAFYFSILGIASTLSIKILYCIKLWEFVKTNLKPMLLIGITQALMCYFHMIALSWIETAYMIALKRTSILFAVILGYFLFKESHILVRLFSVILMLSGIFIITFLR